MSMKWWPILYSNLLNKMGHYFMDMQYELSLKIFHKYFKIIIRIKVNATLDFGLQKYYRSFI